MLLETNQHVQVNLSSAQIENSSSKKLLGVTIHAKLSFENHIEQIYAKVRAKLKALARITCSTNMQKKKVLMKAFLMAQFIYCPLIWMFHNRNLNNKIINLHESCLQIVYTDNTSSVEELFKMDNSV